MVAQCKLFNVAQVVLSEDFEDSWCTGGHVRKEDRFCQASRYLLPRLYWEDTTTGHGTNASEDCGWDHGLVHAQVCSCVHLW